MSISLKKKRKAVAKTFSIPIDPEETDVVDFLYSRRNCATVPESGHRVPQYLVEMDETEHLIWTTLDRICDRDGVKISREVGESWINSIEIAMRRADREARGKANGRAAHV